MSFSLKQSAVNAPFFLIAGPCVIQSEELCLEIAKTVKKIGEEQKIPVVFKASYDKANRTSGSISCATTPIDIISPTMRLRNTFFRKK